MHLAVAQLEGAQCHNQEVMGLSHFCFYKETRFVLEFHIILVDDRCSYLYTSDKDSSTCFNNR